MDKTINQLNELSAVKDNDELIIFDVTNGDSKKAKSGNFFGASINTFICNTELGTAKAVNISGLLVKTGITIDVFFTSGYYGSSDTDVMTLNVNTLGAKKIYVCRHGSKIALAPHSCTRDEGGDATAHYWFIQANTCLKLMYDETLDSNNGGWLVLGNPVVLSSSSANESYTVYADGYISYNAQYPTTPTVVGKWIDGKDIYKVAFNFLQAGSSWVRAQPIDFLGGIDRIVSVQVSRIVNGSTTVVYNGNTEVRISDGYLQINTQADNNTTTDVCILYYTRPSV